MSLINSLAPAMNAFLAIYSALPLSIRMLCNMAWAIVAFVTTFRILYTIR